MSPYISLHLPRSPYISRVPAAHELLVRLGDRNVHEDDQDARLRRAGERRGVELQLLQRVPHLVLLSEAYYQAEM